MIHLYKGPAMADPEPINPLTQRSAAWCEVCKQRRVQTLMFIMPVMNQEMEEHALMAAAFCGPEFRWQCPCGALMSAPGWEATGW